MTVLAVVARNLRIHASRDKGATFLFRHPGLSLFRALNTGRSSRPEIPTEDNPRFRQTEFPGTGSGRETNSN